MFRRHIDRNLQVRCGRSGRQAAITTSPLNTLGTKTTAGQTLQHLMRDFEHMKTSLYLTDVVVLRNEEHTVNW